MESLSSASDDDPLCQTQEHACIEFRAAVKTQLDIMLDEVMVQFKSHIAKTSTGQALDESSSHFRSTGRAQFAGAIKPPLARKIAASRGEDPVSDVEHCEVDLVGHREVNPASDVGHREVTPQETMQSTPSEVTPHLYEHFHLYKTRIEETWQYDLFVGFLIVLNAVSLGWQLEHKARQGEASPSEPYVAASFTVIFLVDILIRLRASKTDFFLGADMYWNVFDFFLVATMILEQVMRMFSFAGSSSLSTLSALRVLRLLRLLRILRILKSLTFLKEFRLLCYTIMSSSLLRILFCVIILLGIFLYITALTLTQLALDECSVDASALSLCRNFGSIPDTLFTLYKVMYGGVVWGQLVDELQQLGNFPAGLLSSFVLLSGAVISNCITGIVIREIHVSAETAQDWRLEDDAVRQFSLVQELKDLFHQIDINDNHSMSFYELDLALKNPQISEIVKSLNLLSHDVQELFHLLDTDNSGEVEMEAFIIECARLRNDARAMDVWQVQNEIKKIGKSLQGVESFLEQKFGKEASEPFEPPQGDTMGSPAHSSQGLYGVSSQEILQLVRDKSHAGEQIKRTEMRAMSVKDLRGVCTWIQSQCLSQEWRDRRTGDTIQPEEVNLYHFNHYVICPLSAPDGILMHVAKNIDFISGQSVLQRKFGEALPVAEGFVKSDSRHGLEVQVTRGRFEVSNGPVEVDAQPVQLCDPVDVLSSLSYKGLISSKPLKPLWFVSHYWGSSVFDFVACCEQHAKIWDLPETIASYWVCGYANRQWAIEMEIGHEIKACSFTMAMELSRGTLLILDKNATPFDRIWCDFEIAKTLMREDMMLDMATILEGDHGAKPFPVILSSGDLPHMSRHAQSARQERFPLRLAVKGILAKLQDGSSSVIADKRNILRHVRSFTFDETVADHDHAKLDSYAFSRVNNALHAHLALCVWPQAVHRGMVLDLDEDRPGTLSLPNVLKEDTGRTSLSLDLSHSGNFDDEGMAAVADGLPPNLKKLDLVFEGCTKVTDQGVRHLAAKLPRRIRSLNLNFTGCNQMTNTALMLLAGRFGHLTRLTQLRLSFASCRNIDVHGLRALVHAIPRSLTDFSIVLLGTRVNTLIKSAWQLERLRRNL